VHLFVGQGVISQLLRKNTDLPHLGQVIWKMPTLTNIIQNMDNSTMVPAIAAVDQSTSFKTNGIPNTKNNNAVSSKITNRRPLSNGLYFEALLIV
jgi:hypothetical protein